MPHVIVEYTANLETQLSPQGLVNALHRAALTTGVFPIGGLRTRAERRDIYAVADGDPDNAFVAVIARIGQGRSVAVRKQVAATLMEALVAETERIFHARGLALSVDVEEIDTATSRKVNNLHERIASKDKQPVNEAVST